MPVCGGTEGSVWPLVGDSIFEKLNVPAGFLCLGVGSSGIVNWSPAQKQQPDGGKPLDGLYDKFMRKYIPSLKPYGFRAVLWHQGETNRETRQEDYYKMMRGLIKAFREDFGDTPWIIAVVGNRWMNPEYGKGCRAAQIRLIEEKTALRGPDTDTLGPQYRQADGKSSHFNETGLKAHADLWAKAIISELFSSGGCNMSSNGH